MPEMKVIEKAVRTIVLGGFEHEFGRPLVEPQEDTVWHKVSSAGTRLWLDTGDIDVASALWNAEFKALTTNNTLLNKEVQKGIYDELIQKAASRIKEKVPDVDEKRLLLEVAFVLNAYHGLRLVERFDAYVSVELHTDVADNMERTVRYAQRFHAVCPERFIIKVPLTPAGFLATRKLSRLGVPVNFTLGFSARQNHLAALLSRPCYVNVFMGRLNAFVAGSGLGDGKNVGEKATMETQMELLELRKAGRTETLLIGASMREGSQVGTLAGLDVFTMPPKVASQYRENPLDEVSSRVGADFPVTFADGVDVGDFNGTTLWDIPDDFKACVDDLLKKDVDNITPEDIRAHFESAGFSDFLPDWSDDDLKTIAADGKIPVYETWKDKLSSGKIGMDALVNMSGLLSFASDQKALDDRIRSLI